MGGTGWGGFFGGSKTEISRLNEEIEVYKEQLQRKLEGVQKHGYL